MKTVYRFVLKAYVGPMVLTFFIVMFYLLSHRYSNISDTIMAIYTESGYFQDRLYILSYHHYFRLS